MIINLNARAEKEMHKIRVLCLGVYSSEEECTTASVNSTAPTIYDFDIVIVDAEEVDIESFFEKKPQFLRFFENGGVCYVFMRKIIFETVGDTRKTNYSFLPDLQFNMDNTEGEWLSCVSENARWMFDGYNFTWDCYVSDIGGDHTALAVNKVKDIVSFIMPIENGHCVFLPQVPYGERGVLVDALIRQGETLFKLEEEIHDIPEWISLYATELERQLLNERDEIERKLGRVGRLKPLLYETGKKLEKEVMRVMKDIGFNVIKLPDGSYADFEFQIDEDQTAVCEIKGLRGSANVNDLRQLLQYFIEQRDIEGRDVIGVFIVNHHRDKNPLERGEPLTQDASALAVKHNFRVISTQDIYTFLANDFDEKLTHQDFIKTFFN